MPRASTTSQSYAVASTSRVDTITKGTLCNLEAQIKHLSDGLTATPAHLVETHILNQIFDQQLHSRSSHDWQSQGNQIQFEFNLDLLNKVTEALTTVETEHYKLVTNTLISVAGDLTF